MAARIPSAISIGPHLQDTGLDKRALPEAERIARDEWRHALMRMTVIDVRDELIAWNQRRGYRRAGITSPFPYGHECFSVPRRDDLRFEDFEKAL